MYITVFISGNQWLRIYCGSVQRSLYTQTNLMEFKTHLKSSSSQLHTFSPALLISLENCMLPFYIKFKIHHLHENPTLGMNACKVATSQLHGNN